MCNAKLTSKVISGRNASLQITMLYAASLDLKQVVRENEFEKKNLGGQKRDGRLPASLVEFATL